jgi:hypothetical protein
MHIQSDLPADQGAGAAALYWSVVQTRIKPHLEQQARLLRRQEQRRAYRRNQVFGLLIAAGAILAWRLFHTNPRWIFPPGWWRP